MQRAAEAVYSPEGKAQCTALIDGYLANAKIIGKAIAELGYSYVGGDNAPYIWIEGQRDSWEFFDLLLEQGRGGLHAGGGIWQMRPGVYPPFGI